MLATTCRQERPLGQVPCVIRYLLALGLVLQVGLHFYNPAPTARADTLPFAPSTAYLRIASLGDEVALSKFLNLWLQMFDNQPGISIPFKALDYDRVKSWLKAGLELDPRGQYPLLAAVSLYGQVADPVKQQEMLEFAYQRFLEDPNERWQWMAHAVLIARHRLKNFELALKYANALADKATGSHVPHWAKQMSIFLLQDMGEKEAARALIGGLLQSGQITDPHEFRFLTERLGLLAEQHHPDTRLTAKSEIGNE